MLRLLVFFVIFRVARIVRVVRGLRVVRVSGLVRIHGLGFRARLHILFLKSSF